MLVVMVRIPVGSQEEGDEIEKRFRSRAGIVDSQPGFVSFELLEGEGEYVAVTRWKDRESLDKWMHSDANRQTHGARPVRSTAHPTPVEGEEQFERHGPATSSVMIYEVAIPITGQG